jgi:serine protease AprX
MKRLQITAQLLLALVIVAALAAPAALATPPLPANKIQPALAALLAQVPDQPVRVIVQKAGQSRQPETFVARLGGTVTKDLHLINGFAAELPGRAVERLAWLASVNWVSLDASVVFATEPTETVRDEFNTITFSGNDGTASWVGDWQEDGDTSGPSSGFLRVVSDSRCASSYCARLGANSDDGTSFGDRSLSRAVDLSLATSATLTFSYQRRSSSGSAVVTLAVSADGGANWTDLASYPLNDSDDSQVFQSFDLSPYLAANTQIRFLGSGSIPEEVSTYFYLDDVQIEFATDGAPPGDPPPGIALPSATIRDEFNATNYNGNDGSLNWASDWQEINESDGPDSGDEQVTYDDGSYRLRIRDNDGGGEGAQRQVDLAGAISATLSFEYRRDGLDSSSDYVAVEISTDNGGSWTELDRLAGSGNDSSYQPWSADISAYLASPTTIRLISSSSMGSYDEVYFDNVQIELVGGNTYLGTTGAAQLHAQGLTGQGVTVAVVDSGIGDHPDFGSRVIAAPLGAGDDYGHGTHVAGIIGGDGSASGGLYTGVAPGVNLVSLKVSNQNGEAYESDVVAAMQWVHENKATYNIRVVNLSLNSTVEDTYHNSGMDAAAEILWLNGVVVVVSAGNFNSIWDWNTINAAPANDPFLIPVGASDEHGDADLANDNIALFSAWGWTDDGHFRPDVIAPGKNIISALAPNSSWGSQYPERIVLDEYIRLSGTSMAAPVVSGAVALLLQAEPELTPDQVKYRLMTCSNTIGILHDYAYLDLVQATACGVIGAANDGVVPHMLLAKMAMIAYWASVNGGEEIDWENVDWEAVNWDAVNWNAVNWNAVNWNSVNWNAVNWNAVNWNSVNWNSVNWNAVNWNSVNWNSVNWNSVLLPPPGGDAPNGGDGRSGVITQPEGLYWGDDEGADLPPSTCPDLTWRKGEPASLDCPLTIWEKGTPVPLLEPVETK